MSESVDWVTVEEREAEWFQDNWAAAASLADDTVEVCLEAARSQCVAFLGRRYRPGQEVKQDWRLAQIMQARALAKAADSDDGQVGPDGLGVTIFPMDWTVKRLLVPERRIGGIA